MTTSPQKTVGTGSTTVHGFAPLGAELPENFLTFEPHVVCLTIADLFRGTASDNAGPHSLAVVELACYAGGSLVRTLNTQEYRAFERKVRRYARVMDRPMYRGMKNLSFARYVLRRAARRAKEEQII